MKRGGYSISRGKRDYVTIISPINKPATPSPQIRSFVDLTLKCQALYLPQKLSESLSGAGEFEFIQILCKLCDIPSIYLTLTLDNRVNASIVMH